MSLRQARDQPAPRRAGSRRRPRRATGRGGGEGVWGFSSPPAGSDSSHCAWRAGRPLDRVATPASSHQQARHPLELGQGVGDHRQLATARVGGNVQIVIVWGLRLLYTGNRYTRT